MTIKQYLANLKRRKLSTIVAQLRKYNIKGTRSGHSCPIHNLIEYELNEKGIDFTSIYTGKLYTEVFTKNNGDTKSYRINHLNNSFGKFINLYDCGAEYQEFRIGDDR